MTVTLYVYTKEKILFNKAPWLDPATAVTINDVHIAGDQDPENPTFTIEGGATYNPMIYTYAYIQEWNRYYFITSRSWLSGNVYQITLQEDYIYTAKSILAVQTGFCRYSGLGDTNLIDPRVSFKPKPKIDSWPIEPVSPATLPDWYCIKFISENPFVGSTTGRCTINIAILNAEAYRAFTIEYKALSETSRVLVAKCIIGVNRVKYLNPTSGIGQTEYGIRFQTPYAENGISSVSVIWLPTTYPDAKCYIITGPDEVRYLNPVELIVNGTGGGSVKIFNTHDRFYELNAQYIIKLWDLQPFEIKPANLGFDSNFRLYLSVAYEPYGENIVITFRKYNETYNNYADQIAYAPIVQRCQTAVAFITDNTVNMYTEATIANEMNVASNIIGGVISIAGAIASETYVGVIPGLMGILSAGNNYDMRQKQLDIMEFLSTGLTGSVSGSVSWSKDAATGFGWCWVVTQDPISTPWGRKGIPDGQWRSILSLAGTGYAEIDIVDIVDNVLYLTENELIKVKEAIANGVIFNATP